MILFPPLSSLRSSWLANPLTSSSNPQNPLNNPNKSLNLRRNENPVVFVFTENSPGRPHLLQHLEAEKKLKGVHEDDDAPPDFYNGDVDVAIHAAAVYEIAESAPSAVSECKSENDRRLEKIVLIRWFANSPTGTLASP